MPIPSWKRFTTVNTFYRFLRHNSLIARESFRLVWVRSGYPFRIDQWQVEITPIVTMGCRSIHASIFLRSTTASERPIALHCIPVILALPGI
ncbi:MAG: hypothetical protein C4527_25215 [Candidatus Omnitrophota bacterium]|nr:MAG: hypothetical protein C4527_25215 [Candidatus Omnitrophota bacterium]